MTRLVALRASTSSDAVELPTGEPGCARGGFRLGLPGSTASGLISGFGARAPVQGGALAAGGAVDVYGAVCAGSGAAAGESGGRSSAKIRRSGPVRECRRFGCDEVLVVGLGVPVLVSRGRLGPGALPLTAPGAGCCPTGMG